MVKGNLPSSALHGTYVEHGGGGRGTGKTVGVYWFALVLSIFKRQPAINVLG